MPHPPDLVADALTYQTPVQFGMVYWVNFGYPSLPAGIEEKRILDWHPALVVSGDPFCRHAGAVNVVALTSYRGKLRPYHHLLLKRDYPLLDTDSLVKTELMYPVLRTLLADQYAICRLNDADLRAIMGKVANSLAITMFYSLHSTLKKEKRWLIRVNCGFCLQLMSCCIPRKDSCL